MAHRDAEPISAHQQRLLDLVEADGAAFAAMGELRGLSPEDAQTVRAMRAQRQQLVALAGEAASSDAMLDNVASMLESEGILTELNAPAAIPVSTFRVERRGMWERLGETAWPRRFAAAAAIGLIAWGGWAAVSAVSSRVSDWQQRQLAERKAREVAPGPTTTPEMVIATNTPSGETSASATGTPDGTAEASPATTLTASEPAAPPTMLELARQGRLVLVVRSTSPERTARAVSGLSRSASEVLATTKLDEAGQQQLMASAAEPMVRTADFARGASNGSAGPALAFSSAARPLDRSLETSAMPWWVGRSGQEVAAAGLEWLQPRAAGGYMLTVRDHDKALDTLRKRLAGSRGVKVELLTLDAPSTATVGESPFMGPEVPGWWTRPPLQWQSVGIPVLIVAP